MYLLDTPVVAALRKAKGDDAEPALPAWAAGIARRDLYLSAIALLELQDGALTAERRDKAAGKAARAWIADRLLPAFEDRILPVDAAIVRRRAALACADPRDALVAATALEHGLTLVTFASASFKGAKVRLFDPRAHRPDARDEGEDWRQAARAGSLWLRNLFVRT